MELETREYLLANGITDIYIDESPDNSDNATIYATGGSGAEEGINNCSFPKIQIIVRNKSAEECINITNSIKTILHDANREQIREVLYNNGIDWLNSPLWEDWEFWSSDLNDPSILLGWRLSGGVASLGRDKNNRWIRSINFSIIRNGV